jgi:hypothetical protein
MLNIQIWKSKPTWLARSSHEKRALIERLTKLIEANLDDSEQEEGGPYLVNQAKDVLLIWTMKASSMQLAVEYERIRLTEDFEPLTSVSATYALTAKKLTERLSR